MTNRLIYGQKDVIHRIRMDSKPLPGRTQRGKFGVDRQLSSVGFCSAAKFGLVGAGETNGAARLNSRKPVLNIVANTNLYQCISICIATSDVQIARLIARSFTRTLPPPHTHLCTIRSFDLEFRS